MGCVGDGVARWAVGVALAVRVDVRIACGELVGSGGATGVDVAFASVSDGVTEGTAGDGVASSVSLEPSPQADASSMMPRSAERAGRGS